MYILDNNRESTFWNEYDPVVNEDKLARSISLFHYQQNRILEIVTLIHLQNEYELVENVVRF